MMRNQAYFVWLNKVFVRVLMFALKYFVNFGGYANDYGEMCAQFLMRLIENRFWLHIENSFE